jgi:3-oxoacyl-[acyl-carrier protein] reductase
MAFRGLAGKTAIVTGAAQGIGAGVVERLAAEGCRVVAVDVKPIAAKGEAILPFTADVSTEAGCDAYVQAAVERFGSVDLFFNNAGVIGKLIPIHELPLEEFDRVHAVNVRGVFLGLRAVLRRMVAQGRGGAIVSTASVGAIRGHRGSAAYASSKRAVIGLSQAAALENGARGIRVNTICPGPVDTPMLQPALGTGIDIAMAFANQAIPRAAQPAEIAAFVAYLLSDEASFHTGGIYPVDGGFTI